MDEGGGLAYSRVVGKSGRQSEVRCNVHLVGWSLRMACASLPRICVSWETRELSEGLAGAPKI